MIEHKFNDSTFIKGFYIPETVCDNVIKFFNDHPDQKYPSQIGSKPVVDLSRKKGTEMFCPVEVIDFHLPDYLKCLHQGVKNYMDKFPEAQDAATFKVEKNIKIQHYLPGEGFYKWHYENTGRGDSIKRHLVFMTYLNNVKDGGTEFKYQNITSPAIKGLTLIWPAIWTHTHRGQISPTESKTIITGWFSYVS